MYRLIIALVFALSVVKYGADSANVLGIFDFPSKSLHILGETLLVGLAKRGFNVTMISSYPMKKTIANYTHIEIDGLNKFKEENLKDLLQGTSKFGALKMLTFLPKLTEMSVSSPEVQNLLKSDTKFDVIIQIYMFSEAYLGIAHHFDAPVIAFVPFTGVPHINDITGNPAPYSYVPLFMSKFTQDMTFLQRTTNTVLGLIVNALGKFYFLPNQQALIEKYFPNAPPIEQLQDRVDMVFVNSHVSTESPRPYVSNIIQIGGYHIEEPEALTPDLKKFLDESKQGVIFFCFGSNVQSSKLPKETLDIFVKKFEKLNVRILWKFEDDFPNKPKNVFISNWLPQRGILAHPNIKAFISHGGMGSTTEALYFGVPMICIPFFGDQEKNCEMATIDGYGVNVPYKDLTASTFSKAVDEIMNNPTYAESAKFKSELFRNQPMKPIDKAAFWVNHVVKYKGAKHLKTKAATMPFYKYLLLDVLAFLGTVAIVLLGILYFVTKWILRKLFSKKKPGKKVKRN